MTNALTEEQRERVLNHAYTCVETESDLRELADTVRKHVVSVPGHHDCEAVSTGIALALNTVDIPSYVANGKHTQSENELVPHTWVEIPNNELVFTETDTASFIIDATIGQFTEDNAYDNNILTAQLADVARKGLYYTHSKHKPAN